MDVEAEVEAPVDPGSAPEEMAPEVPADGSAPEAVAAPEPEGSAPAEPVDDEPEEFKNLLAKHKGDRGAAARDYWETKSWASTVRQENEALRAELQQLRTSQPRPVAEPDAPKPVHPELKAVEEEITAFNARKGELVNSLKEAGATYFAKRDEVIRAEARREIEVAKAEDFEKAAIKERWDRHIAMLEATRDTALRDHNLLKRQIDGLPHEEARLNRDKRFAEQLVAQEEARQQQEAAELQRFNKEFPVQIDGYIKATADELKVPNDPKVRQGLSDLVNDAAIKQYLLMGGVDTRRINHQALIKDLTSKVWSVIDNVSRARLGKTAAIGTPSARTTVPARPVNRTQAPAFLASPEEAVANDPTLKKARERLAAFGL